MSVTTNLVSLNRSFIQESFEKIVSKEKLSFKKDEYIFHQNKIAEGLYVIVSGIVKINKITNKENELIIGLAKTGDFIGQQFIFGSNINTNSAKAIGNVVLFFFPKDDVLNLLNSDPSLRLQVLLLLCNDVENKEAKIAEKVFKNLKEQVADTLMLLYKEYGTKRNSTVNMGITLIDLASFAGISVTYLRKVLLTFEQNDFIQIRNKKSVSDEPLKIKITNKKALRYHDFVNL